MGYVFISYSTKHQTAADTLQHILRKEQIETWMAPNSIPAGKKYPAVITDAIRNSSCVILLLSEAAQNSQWIAKEVEIALNCKKTIVPIQMEPITLNDEFSFYLSNIQILPVGNLNQDTAAIQNIIKVVREHTEGNSFSIKYPLQSRYTIKDYQELLVEFFGILTAIRRLINRDNTPDLSDVFERATTTASRIYDIYEFSQYKDPTLSQRCKNVVDRYNEFVDTLHQIRESSPNRKREKADQLRIQSNDRFRNCMQLIIKEVDADVSAYSLDDYKKNLVRCLEALYAIRQGINSDDTTQVNAAFADASDVASMFYSIYEFNQFRNPDLSARSKILVDYHNKFARSLFQIRNIPQHCSESLFEHFSHQSNVVFHEYRDLATKELAEIDNV